MLDLQVARPDGDEVWRVGYRPEPWAWVGWEHATGGRFNGRWDDHSGNFRTVYAGSRLLACLLELLADYRPDPFVIGELTGIEEDPEDARLHPTSRAGELSRSWLEPRAAAVGRLHGEFCAVTAAESIAALHPVFVGLALQMGLKDFDAAALKDGRVRALTQLVSTHLYETTDLDGIQFASRHGDDLALWAIFERLDDPPVTPKVTNIEMHDLTPDHPEILEALRIHGLRWAEE